MAGDDGALILWNRAPGERLRAFGGHRAEVVAIVVSPGGRIAATSGRDRRAGLWDRSGASPVRPTPVGRRAGTAAGYRYSATLGDSGIGWDAVAIDRLLGLGPDHYTPGSKMPMQRIAAPEERRELIEFLAASAGPRARQMPAR